MHLQIISKEHSVLSIWKIESFYYFGDVQDKKKSWTDFNIDNMDNFLDGFDPNYPPIPEKFFENSINIQLVAHSPERNMGIYVIVDESTNGIIYVFKEKVARDLQLSQIAEVSDIQELHTIANGHHLVQYYYVPYLMILSEKWGYLDIVDESSKNPHVLFHLENYTE